MLFQSTLLTLTSLKRFGASTERQPGMAALPSMTTVAKSIVTQMRCNVFDKECCIAGCNSPGVHCLDGRWYCYTCWKDEGKDGRPSPQKIVSERVSGNLDYNGAGEPDADFVRGEAIRVHGTGIFVDQTLLPPVSDSVAEECRKEIEMAKRRGWKKSQ